MRKSVSSAMLHKTMAQCIYTYTVTAVTQEYQNGTGKYCTVEDRI